MTNSTVLRWATKIDAGNDSNGNPRRAYLVYEMDSEIQVPFLVQSIDEGYAGRSALDAHYPTTRIAEPTIKVPVKEYNKLIKEFKTC